jgi:hypothetical protein
MTLADDTEEADIETRCAILRFCCLSQLDGHTLLLEIYEALGAIREELVENGLDTAIGDLSNDDVEAMCANLTRKRRR